MVYGALELVPKLDTREPPVPRIEVHDGLPTHFYGEWCPACDGQEGGCIQCERTGMRFAYHAPHECLACDAAVAREARRLIERWHKGVV